MGDQRRYQESGGFSEYLYVQIGETIVASNGVEGKVVTKIDGTAYDGLPTYSNTSEIYLKKNAQGEIIQARVYKDRKPVMDLDWDHPHENKNGEKFPKGVVHVQLWKDGPKGKPIRDSGRARYMNNEEVSRYGELIQKANSDAKLRP